MNDQRQSNQKHTFHDPVALLQSAIHELEVFTQAEECRLEVDPQGHLTVAEETRLERLVNVVRGFIGSLFSDECWQQREKKLHQIKQAILQARDTIQSHSALIQNFQQGDESQRKLAAYALNTIQCYNTIVIRHDLKWTAKYNINNYERNCLLDDSEIKGRVIELPHTIVIKYDSHPNSHPAHKMFKELGESFLPGASKKSYSMIHSTHKKNQSIYARYVLYEGYSHDSNASGA